MVFIDCAGLIACPFIRACRVFIYLFFSVVVNCITYPSPKMNLQFCLLLSFITFYINFHLLEITGRTWLRRRSSQYFARPDKRKIPKSDKCKEGC